MAIVGSVLASVGFLAMVGAIADRSLRTNTQRSFVSSLLPQPLWLGLALAALGVGLTLGLPVFTFTVAPTATAVALLGLAYTRPSDTARSFQPWLDGVSSARALWPAYLFVLLPIWGLQLWLKYRFADTGSLATMSFWNDFLARPEPTVIDPDVIIEPEFSPFKSFLFIMHFAVLWLVPVAVMRDGARARRTVIAMWCEGLLTTLFILLIRRVTLPAPFHLPPNGVVAFHAVWALRGAVEMAKAWPRLQYPAALAGLATIATCLAIKETGVVEAALGAIAFGLTEALVDRLELNRHAGRRALTALVVIVVATMWFAA